MGKTNSIVEVNGSRYNALTGQLLSPRKSRPQAISSGKKMIDGFVIGAHHKTTKALAKPRVQQAPAKAQGLHQRTQRSSTLMRHIVKKPDISKKENNAASVQARDIKPHPVRVSRAKTIMKHDKVNRFGAFPPAAQSPTQPQKMSITAKASYRADTATVVAPRVPSMITSASHNKLERMLDEALTKANAHKQMMNSDRNHSRLRQRLNYVPKWISITVVVVVVIAAAFWLVWQNLPTVAVHVAAARAHVNASIPSYTPSGFNIAGPVQYHDGAVTMQFRNKVSTGTEREFSITQKASNWNSTSLEANYLPNEQSVQTSLVGGTTVYIYGNKSDAAWVNHGVLYNLDNKAQLSSDQVLKIVQSL
ncbi:MAG: hypothetical protein JWO96_311 [Candidatus Saccharibacteria bacterium]|nr:hypothetical protein [Candidatus Saccharibacteria bacterium]